MFCVHNGQLTKRAKQIIADPYVLFTNLFLRKFKQMSSVVRVATCAELDARGGETPPKRGISLSAAPVVSVLATLSVGLAAKTLSTLVAHSDYVSTHFAIHLFIHLFTTMRRCFLNFCQTFNNIIIKVVGKFRNY